MIADNFNFLIIWDGGREHSIVKKLSGEKSVNTIYHLCDNPWILAEPKTQKTPFWNEALDLNSQEVQKLIDFCRDRVDCVIIGPEKPLCDGIWSIFKANNIPFFGVEKQTAMLEGSKAFADEFCREFNIPRPESYIAFTREEALQYIESLGEKQIVIKADGLADGKGVVISKSMQNSIGIVEKHFEKKPWEKIVFEEYIDGEEISVFYMVDTTSDKIQFFSTAKDHKQRYEPSIIRKGDNNPMTGGMGTISPSPLESDTTLMEKFHTISEKFLGGLKKRNLQYQWVVFMWFIVDTKTREPKLIEFNVRFWDPEIQSILARMTSDFSLLILSIALWKLNEKLWAKFSEKKAINLVLADQNYGLTYSQIKTWQLISWLDAIPPDIKVIHSWTTRWKDGRLYTSGGRVLWLVTTGDSYDEIWEKVLSITQHIKFDGKFPHFRNDIHK